MDRKYLSLKILIIAGITIITHPAYHTCLAEEQTEPDQRKESLSLDEFVSRAARNDTEFEEILIRELTLKYQKDLQLPARDLVLSMKQEHQAFLSQNREELESTISVSKLFPRAGTEMSIAYQASPSFSSEDISGKASLSFSQPIAKNAFGAATRLHEKIIGLETDIAKHQIVEAYEDYLAAIITIYHHWQESYDNLLIGRSSYTENMKLLENIKERQKNQVARAVDVNKINLQVIAKKEALVELEVEYDKYLLNVQQVIRHDGKTALMPEPSSADIEIHDSFEKTFDNFVDTSRTFNILTLLKEKSSLEVDKDADELLPSINLVLGGEITGDGHNIDNNDDMIFAGITLEWPFPDQTDRAKHKISEISLMETTLLTGNARYRLYTDIKNLFYEIGKEKRLKEIAEEKINLAQSILQDETENYSFAKVSLNDYIDAVNTLDRNHFNKILHDTRYRILMVEWLRLTDRLITREDIQTRHH